MSSATWLALRAAEKNVTCKPCSVGFLRDQSKSPRQDPEGGVDREGSPLLVSVSFFTWNLQQHWIKDKCLFCFQQNTHPNGNCGKPCFFFQTKARKLCAPHCAQPPVPTGACVLHWLTSFQACREESPVAQGSAVATAANGRGQGREEAQMMCGGHKFHFLSFPCFLCAVVYLFFQGTLLDPSPPISANSLLISHNLYTTELNMAGSLKKYLVQPRIPVRRQLRNSAQKAQLQCSRPRSFEELSVAAVRVFSSGMALPMSSIHLFYSTLWDIDPLDGSIDSRKQRRSLGLLDAKHAYVLLSPLT